MSQHLIARLVALATVGLVLNLSSLSSAQANADAISSSNEIEINNLNFISTQLGLNPYYAFRPVRPAKILVVAKEGPLITSVIEQVATYGYRYPHFHPEITLTQSAAQSPRPLNDFDIVLALTNDPTLKHLENNYPTSRTIFLAREGLDLPKQFLTIGSTEIQKPLVNDLSTDFRALSWVQLSEESLPRNSATAALLVTAGLSILKSLEPELLAEAALERTRKYSPYWYYGLELAELGFGTTGPNCFRESQIDRLPSHIIGMQERGAILVETTLGSRLMIPIDPADLAPHLRRNLRNDMYLVTPHGLTVYPRYNSAGAPSTWVEVFQRPVNTSLCHSPKGTTNNFAL